MNDCLRMFGGGRRIVVFGDMNGRVGKNELAGVVGKWRGEGVTETGEHLVDICAERGLFLADTFFQHKMIHWYTWRRREDRGEEKSLIDYIAVDERLRKDVLDAKVVAAPPRPRDSPVDIGVGRCIGVGRSLRLFLSLPSSLVF